MSNITQVLTVFGENFYLVSCAVRGDTDRSTPVWYDDNKKYENQQKKDLSARRGKRVSGSDGQKT